MSVEKDIEKSGVSKIRRIEELDALRGIAAIAVSFAHFHVGSTLLDQIGVYAQHGVELFFLISGFVIFMTLQKKQNVFDFAVARFARLYPAYLVSVGFIALLSFLFSNYIDDPPSTKAFLYNLMIWHPLFHVESVTVVYWTLWVEVRFYALMALILIFRQTQRIQIYLWLWLVFVCVYELAGYVIHGGEWKIPYLSFGYAMAIPGFARYFISGIVFYKMMRKEATTGQYFLLLACILRELYFFSSHRTPIVLGCYVLFFFMAFDKLKFLRQKPLLFLGKISYSLYLIHQVVGTLIIKWLSMHTSVGPTIKFICAEVISIILAIGMTYTIEYPAMHFIRKQYRAIRPLLSRDKAKAS